MELQENSNAYYNPTPSAVGDAHTIKQLPNQVLMGAIAVLAMGAYMYFMNKKHIVQNEDDEEWKKILLLI